MGSLTRYAFSIWVPATDIPRGTLIANVISCLLLGLVMGLYGKSLLADHHKLLVATGFCGGFSTFSTYSAEIVQMYQDGQMGTAIIYAGISLVLGLLAIGAGLWLAQYFTAST